MGSGHWCACVFAVGLGLALAGAITIPQDSQVQLDQVQWQQQQQQQEQGVNAWSGPQETYQPWQAQSGQGQEQWNTQVQEVSNAWSVQQTSNNDKLSGQQGWATQNNREDQWQTQQTNGQNQQWNYPEVADNSKGQPSHQQNEDEKKQSQIEHEWSPQRPGASGSTPTPWAWESGRLPAGQAKQPVVQRPGLAPAHSELERVLNDSRLQRPLAVVVDTDPASLHHARRHWMAVDEGTLSAQEQDFQLVTFNDTRATLGQRVQGVSALRRALDGLQGSANRAQGAGFLALLRASQRLPLRSAALLFTGRPSADEAYGAIASQELLNKDCRLFVWWSGSRRFGGSGAERLYREAVEHTGGIFTDKDAPNTDHEDGGYPEERPPALPTSLPVQSGLLQMQEHTQVILAARQDLYGTTTTPVLVDSTVGELLFIILGHITEATVRTPSGAVFNLLHGTTDVTADENEHTNTSASGLVERQLNTRGERPGLWQLTTSDEGSSTGEGGYDVIVKGTSVLRVGFLRPDKPALHEDGDLVVTIHGGPRTNITGLVLLDNKGNELRKTYYKQRVRRDEQNREIIELSVPQQALQLQQQQQAVPHYVRVNGYNGGPGGEAFTRITPQIPTTGSLIVSLNAASNLTIQAGTQSQIYLDVINNGSRPSRMYVYGSSARNILYRLTPNNFQLNPNQRMVVTLQVYPPTNMLGATDTLKVQVHSELSIYELFLELTIADNNYVSRDTTKPSLKRRILNNCKELTTCSSRQWNMELTVEDNGSGIREITSVPQGVIWTPVVIGTKLPITLKYRASCCDESVIITATDLQNNIARYTINVNDDSTGLSPGVIAGIVVGVLAILIIITGIIIFICKKKKTTHTFQSQQVAR